MKILFVRCCLIFFFYILVVGCTLPSQIRSYTEYQFHDLVVEDEKVLILMGKKKYSPEISVKSAMVGHIPSKDSYTLLSYALLSFRVSDFYHDSNKSIINLLNKKNIVNNLNYKGKNSYLRNRIINHEKLLFWNDIVNGSDCISVINFGDNLNSNTINCNTSAKNLILSFNRKFYFYTIDNKGFLYKLYDNKDKNSNNIKLVNKIENNFSNTQYLMNDGLTFLDYFPRKGSEKNSKFQKINKYTNDIYGEISTDFRILWDYHDNKDYILAYRRSIGLSILDLNGNSLYTLKNNSIGAIKRAVLHEDKVYAAGITTRDSPLGKKEYIEIIQWDYKNDSVIKKYYPCDSPELEM